MEFYDRAFIDELKVRSDIIDVVSRYVQGMTLKGKNYLACCPFHREKTPSFAVNRYEQFFKCFGCGKGGDVIRFIQEIENVDYVEAVSVLARYANMALPEGGEDAKQQLEKKQKKDKSKAILKAAAHYYHQNLKEKGYKASEYLSGRGISDALIVRFGLGYSSDGNTLLNVLSKNGFSEHDMLLSGVAQKNEGGGMYDAMVNRLVFPIIDVYGDVIGFSGRILDNREDIAKYKNTPATMIFDKSRSLYGVNLLKREKQAHGISDVILVEGHMDLLSLAAVDIKNSVASMGTAFTRSQAQLIKRFSQNVFICFDGDTAGVTATLKGLDVLADEGLDVKVIALPDGMDPDDAIKTYGKEYFFDLKHKALGLYDYKIQVVKQKYDLTSSTERAKFAAEAIEVIAQSRDPLIGEAYLENIVAASGMNYDVLRDELIKQRNKRGRERQNNNGEVSSVPGFDYGEAHDKAQVAKTSGETTATPFEQAATRSQLDAARFVLCAILLKKAYAPFELIGQVEEFFVHETHKDIIRYIQSVLSQGKEPLVSGVYDGIKDVQEIEKITAMDKTFIKQDDEKKYFFDAIKTLKKQKNAQDLKLLLQLHSAETDEVERQKIGEKIKGLLEAKSQLA